MNKAFIVMTRGFHELPADIGGDILSKGINLIKPDNPDFIVFDPKAEKDTSEDDGRTLHIAYPKLDAKVYVKLDDYGSKEVLSESVGSQVATQYAVTFMLAEEY
ncbi:MAG: hypothetical protein GWP10_06345 [Nitrospiraceae bacterium]|nr:hypothetical protein [Nitrospiraceae bacterium]